MASITFSGGPLVGRKFELRDGIQLMGRSPQAEISIPDGEVSGRHAQLQKKDGQWWVFDLQSSNGTIVNGVGVQAQRLHNGDRIVLSEVTSFVYNEDGAAPSALPPPPTSSKVAAKSLPATAGDVDLVRQMRDRTDAIRKEVGKVIIGQRDVLDQVLMCLIAGGHGLLIGLPGMAKTLMVKTVARVLDLSFRRVQFTPDLMPTDITGTEVLETNKNTGEKEFRFIKGPIFCNLLLADEINRTPPKTQSALLEAMQEKRVTAGNRTFTLEEPYFVLATQNPIEQEGTYPLPEAQLDRFMFNIWVDYPTQEEEEHIVGSTTTGVEQEVRCVLSKDEVLLLQRVVRQIPVSPHVIKYVISLVRATRPSNPEAPEVTKNYVSTGAGPRAGQYLTLAAKAMAVLDGRIHVSCADIKKAAIPVLRHRILTNFAADSEGIRPMDIVQRLLAEIPEPGEEAYGGAQQPA